MQFRLCQGRSLEVKIWTFKECMVFFMKLVVIDFVFMETKLFHALNITWGSEGETVEQATAFGEQYLFCDSPNDLCEDTNFPKVPEVPRNCSSG